MNKFHEFQVINNEEQIVFNRIISPNSKLIYSSFPFDKKSYQFSCDLNKTRIQFNKNYMVFSEKIFEPMLKYLQYILKSPVIPFLKNYYFIELKNVALNLQNTNQISSFLLQKRNDENERKKIDFSTWEKNFVYILYGCYFLYFDENNDIFYINLETSSKNIIKLTEYNKNKSMKPLTFCEFKGDFIGNVFLLVYLENIKKYSIFELNFHDERPEILNNIILPNNVINSMRFNFFQKDFELMIFSHDFLFPGKQITNHYVFFIFHRYSTCCIFRILIYDQRSNIFLNYFNFESNIKWNTLNMNIVSLNNNLFCKIDENFIFIFRYLAAIKGFDINEKQMTNKHFYKELIQLKLIKSLMEYKNYEDLSYQTRDIIAKVLKNDNSYNDNILRAILRHFLNTVPIKIFYLIKYLLFINVENEGRLETYQYNIYKKIWNLMDFYTNEKKNSKKSNEKRQNLTEFDIFLQEFDDYDYVWFHFALKLKEYDFIRDMIMFNKKFADSKYSKPLQKILILCKWDEK